MTSSEIISIQQWVANATEFWGKETGRNKGTGRPEIHISDLFLLTATLRDRWLKNCLGPVNDHSFRRYVRFHQVAITDLSNSLNSILDNRPKENDDQQAELLNQARTELEKQLHFLRHTFYDHFDLHYHITDYFLREKLPFLKQILSELIQWFAKGDIDPELTGIIENTFNGLLALCVENGSSYDQIDRLRVHLENLAGMARKNKVDAEALFLVLFRHNFNIPAILHWFERKHRRKNDKNRNNTLGGDSALQQLQSVLVEKKTKLVVDHPSIDEQLDVLIRSISLSTDKQIKSLDTLPLRIPVAQLALFARLCQKKGCFQVIPDAQIIKFFSRRFATKKQQFISPKSFGRLFYKAEQTTAAVLRGNLHEMILWLDMTYFPKN